MTLKEVKRRWKTASETGKLTKSMKQILKLWKKHEGKCHICGQLVPNPLLQTELLTSSNYPSRDHIIPKSKGGSYKQKNLLLAHRKCNVVRGNIDIYDIPTKLKHKTWEQLKEGI